MNWLTVAVHWLHVLFAVTWFGGHIARVLLVEPVVRTLPEAAQEQFNASVGRRATRLYVPVIVGVGVTGILRGTVFGPIRSLDILLGTTYGISFLAAVALGLLLAVPTKPDWMERARINHLAFLAVFTAMILMHFGL